LCSSTVYDGGVGGKNASLLAIPSTMRPQGPGPRIPGRQPRWPGICAAAAALLCCPDSAGLLLLFAGLLLLLMLVLQAAPDARCPALGGIRGADLQQGWAAGQDSCAWTMQQVCARS
jgi:hypothetical protein